jgi:hypothetical protein
MYGELLSLRRSKLMCGRWLSMFWTCYKPLQVSRSGGLILTQLYLVSLMHSGYGHLKVEVLHNVMESFVKLYLFIIGFQLECLLHQFRVFGNYWRCIPVDEVQKKLCYARQGSKTIWDLKMGQKLSSLK